MPIWRHGAFVSNSDGCCWFSAETMEANGERVAHVLRQYLQITCPSMHQLCFASGKEWNATRVTERGRERGVEKGDVIVNAQAHASRWCQDCRQSCISTPKLFGKYSKVIQMEQAMVKCRDGMQLSFRQPYSSASSHCANNETACRRSAHIRYHVQFQLLLLFRLFHNKWWTRSQPNAPVEA